MIPKEEFRAWTQQTWTLQGASTRSHPAPFPYEIARRLVLLLLARSRIWLDCLSSLRSDAAAFSLAQSVARPLLAPNFLIDSGDDCGLDGRFVAREQLFECCHQFPFAARPTPIQNARLQMSHIPISVIHPSEPGEGFMINDRAINRQTFSTIFCLHTQGASDVEAVLGKFSERLRLAPRLDIARSAEFGARLWKRSRRRSRAGVRQSPE
jgi:hypothetical protein